MNAATMTVLLGRQFRALRASWATWALVGAAVFFAVLSPVTARYLPEILGGIIGGDQAIPSTCPHCRIRRPPTHGRSGRRISRS